MKLNPVHTVDIVIMGTPSTTHVMLVPAIVTVSALS